MGKAVEILIARVIFAAMFVMAASSKFMGMGAAVDHIAAAGFPFPLILAWGAAFFEIAFAIGLLSGVFFSKIARLAAAYVIFLAFAFHGPSHWAGSLAEFGIFVDHVVFMAGLLIAAGLVGAAPWRSAKA